VDVVFWEIQGIERQGQDGVKSGRLGGYLFFAGSLVLVGLIFWSLSG
jgi:hypothetical protein